MISFDRRSFVRHAGAIGLLGTLPQLSDAAALGSVTHEVLQAQQQPESQPKDSVPFGVCGMSHSHIYGMIGAMQNGGGKLVKIWADEPDTLAAAKKRFPDVPVAASQDELLHDPQIKLVLSSEKANQRAGIGVRAMKAGKDYLSDKPGVTTLEDLALIRKTIAETGRIYGIMYSERLEVKAAVYAGELVRQGAIGDVIQTINIAPHQINQRPGGDAGSSGGNEGRPDWFWNEVEYGGILCDIGSHQVDQFLFYTGSRKADVVAAQIANVRHANHPHFQDFGDMMLRGNNGFGYVRLDWFTPNGVGTWGDGRLFILGTNGYIEARKYANIAVSKQGNNLFLVDGKQARMIDCNAMELPFGRQFISDVVNRTHTAQDQEQCLLAMELVLKAQKMATRTHLDWEQKAGGASLPAHVEGQGGRG